jgi:hypothetical protein
MSATANGKAQFSWFLDGSQRRSCGEATELPAFLFLLQVVSKRRGKPMSLILLIILVLLLLAVLPAWPYSRGWGYYPSGGLGVVLIIILILVLSGRI